MRRGREEDAAGEEVQEGEGEGEAQVQGLQQAQGRQDPERAAAAPAGAPRPRHRVVVHLPPQARRVRYTCAARFSPSPVPHRRRRFREFSSVVAAFPQICAGGRSARASRRPPRPPAHPGMPLSPMAGCGSQSLQGHPFGGQLIRRVDFTQSLAAFDFHDWRPICVNVPRFGGRQP